METIEFKTMSGFRVKLFRHEIKQIEEIPFFKTTTGEGASGRATIVLTAWGEKHTIDEVYDSVNGRVFGE